MYHYINGLHIDLLKVNFISLKKMTLPSLTLSDNPGDGIKDESEDFYNLEIVFSGCKEPTIVEQFPANDIEKKKLDGLIESFEMACGVE